MSEHVLVTDAKAETKHVCIRQNRAKHGQKPEARGHATRRKALPEQSSDEPVRDNGWHKDQFGWRWQSFLLLILTLVTASAQAQSRNGTLIVNGGTLIDGTGAPPVPDATIVISGDRIAAAGPLLRITAPKSAKTVDARGKWIIPGLIDAHVHFFQSGGLYTRPDVIDLRQRVPYERELTWIGKRLPYTFTRYLCSGITSVVDVGGPFANFNVRAMARRTRAAPHVAVAGPLISTVAEDLETADPAIIEVTNPEEAVALVRRELARKPDLMKIWFIRGPDVELEHAVKMVEAVVKASHAADVRVAVHATELETAKAAVSAGADILVHSVSDRPVDDEFVQMVKERGVIYTTTIVVLEGYAEVLGQRVDLTDVERSCGDTQVIASWADLAKIPKDRLPFSARFPPHFTEKATILANLKRMQEAGAIVAAGTDAGNIGTLHGPSLHREFEFMAEGGLTPMQIIIDATHNAARVFSPNPQTGTIESGKLADLVILDADPLADIRNARQINTVIKGGYVFEVSKLKSQQVRKLP
jgi:imidazolonepropionase-like amidohydrolase